MSATQPLRLSALRYLNTRPFLHGLNDLFQKDPITVTLGSPAECAADFFEGRADVALVSVGALVGQSEVVVMEGYCIGAHEKVDSVFLVGHDEPEEMQVVYLNPESRTSNLLVQMLFKTFWKREVEFRITTGDPMAHVGPEVGAVMIGDTALKGRKTYKYAKDLVEAWHVHTGLPFTFAVWCTHPAVVPQGVIDRLRIGFRNGLRNLPQVAEIAAPIYDMKPVEILRYYAERIAFDLDTSHKYALKQFLDRASKLQGVEPPVLKFV